MNFFKKERIILLMINLVIAIVLLVIIGYIVLNRLNGYTDHGYYISVPELRGLTPSEAEPFAKEKQLRTIVIDSIYDNNAQPGTIVEQFPSPNSQVKNNRLIHLTINANAPEKLIFPNLRNSAFRQTLQTLRSMGLNVGRIEYAPSEFKNLVLDFKYHGYPLTPDSQIQKGETVDIVLGDGNTTDNQTIIPVLLGKTLFEAKNIALQSFLNIGEIIPDNTVLTEADRMSAIVYMQSPGAGENATTNAGNSITIYLTKDVRRLTEVRTEEKTQTEIEFTEEEQEQQQE